jgi:hypothetical protein
LRLLSLVLNDYLFGTLRRFEHYSEVYRTASLFTRDEIARTFDCAGMRANCIPCIPKV